MKARRSAGMWSYFYRDLFSQALFSLFCESLSPDDSLHRWQQGSGKTGAGPWWRGWGEWCRSLNTEMATDNHLTHNSPPRGENCPPWPALNTRLWRFSVAHDHTCNKLGISRTLVSRSVTSLCHTLLSRPWLWSHWAQPTLPALSPAAPGPVCTVYSAL